MSSTLRARLSIERSTHLIVTDETRSTPLAIYYHTHLMPLLQATRALRHLPLILPQTHLVGSRTSLKHSRPWAPALCQAPPTAGVHHRITGTAGHACPVSADCGVHLHAPPTIVVFDSGRLQGASSLSRRQRGASPFSADCGCIFTLRRLLLCRTPADCRVRLHYPAGSGVHLHSPPTAGVHLHSPPTAGYISRLRQLRSASTALSTAGCIFRPHPLPE
ncbi:unnamed protein product [Pieris brassicae]|uniref:Uncharacterized protein n=1 Tax=Pieris brassicae TaxID=7116 RepID=A0A9P0XHQ9_PIEBR|nr:unnamed protein product [Pieris brassicae]